MIYMEHHFEKGTKILFKLVRWFVSLLARLIILGLVMVLYVVSLPVTLLGELLLRIQTDTELIDLGISVRFEKLRSDIISILEQYHNPSDHTTSRGRLRSEIIYQQERAVFRSEVGETVVSFWGGLLAVSLVVFDLWPWGGTVLSIFVLVITASILIRVVVLQFLAFGESDVKGEMDRTRLEVMLGWNRAVLTSFRSHFAILILVILGWTNGLSYDFGKGIWERYAEWKMK
jgi:hypothetical protein